GRADRRDSFDPGSGHEIVKEVLRRQNAFIENAIHEAGHVIGPLVARLRAASALQSWTSKWPTARIAGSLEMCPVAGPHSLIDTFGAPRPGGRVHEGNDILAAQW